MRYAFVYLFCLMFGHLSSQIVYRVAGTCVLGFSGDGLAAAMVPIGNVDGLAVDKAGNVYFTESNRVRKVSTTGIINTIAGTFTPGFSGDGGPAINCSFDTPKGITIDTIGNLYVCDLGNARIRIIDTNGIITTYAGTGINGTSGDGGSALLADISLTESITVDRFKNIYFGSNNSTIRKINSSGVISTVAGTGVGGFSGDGGNALLALISIVTGIECDDSGNIYFADFANRRVRKISTSGVITTIGGNGISGYSGTGGLAVNASISVRDVVVDAFGNVFIVEDYGRIRKIDTSGNISLVAGTGNAGCNGDGGPALLADMGGFSGFDIDKNNNLFFGQIGPGPIGQVVRAICNTSCFASVESEKEVKLNVSVYPNPTSDYIIVITTDSFLKGRFRIFNHLVEVVFEQKVIAGDNKLFTPSLPDGMYYYVVEDTNGMITQGKIIFQNPK